MLGIKTDLCMKKYKNTSLYLFILISILLSTYRLSQVSSTETSWDVLGYYLPLPATFIHHDPLLHDISWLKETNKKMNLAGTLFMLSYDSKGQAMYFFLFGMALLYLPFFALGHLSAYILGFPMDGFSLPYQYALVVGAILYTLIGLWYLRKILRHFFPDIVVAIIIFVLVVATNYIHHLTLKDLETVNSLFMFSTLVIWNTIRWHQNYKFSNLLLIVLSIGFMGFIKPSEIVIALIPILWNVDSKAALLLKWERIIQYKKQFIVAFVLLLILLSPQMIYWTIKTGFPIYDSYKNPGIGLDLWSPHSWDSLFSYRKGWLLYTPVMLFFLWGFIPMYHQNKKLFYPLFIYFIISFYIISSWSEWWYGAAFSNRPLITTYPVLAIAFGYFLKSLSIRNRWVKISFAFVVFLFIGLNQFQWWQLKNYILDPYRTTKAYYWATFLKTKATDADKKLLLVKRSFSGQQHFSDSADYISNRVGESFFKDNEQAKTNFLIPKEQEFVHTIQIPFKKLSDKDHLWIIVSFDAKLLSSLPSPPPDMVITMNRSGGDYGYFAPSITFDSTGVWKHFQFDYMTPEIRSRRDRVKYFFWNRSHSLIKIRAFKVLYYQHK